jgi:hypothetical protein
MHQNERVRIGSTASHCRLTASPEVADDWVITAANSGLIVLLAGVLGLLLSLLVWGPLNPARRRANAPVGYEASTPPTPPIGHERPLYRDERHR